MDSNPMAALLPGTIRMGTFPFRFEPDLLQGRWWRAREPASSRIRSVTNTLLREALWSRSRLCLVATRRVKPWRKPSATSRKLSGCIWRASRPTEKRFPRKDDRFKEGSPLLWLSPLDGWPGFRLWPPGRWSMHSSVWGSLRIASEEAISSRCIPTRGRERSRQSILAGSSRSPFCGRSCETPALPSTSSLAWFESDWGASLLPLVELSEQHPHGRRRVKRQSRRGYRTALQTIDSETAQRIRWRTCAHTRSEG